ncbi:adenylosuccinate lyase family protein [Azospirillum griseum]|uniref:Adenylosuccinate lyase family protein n=2 Tax=Azospirillum griseum TaxID=2496639 RepID=A0A431VBD9_9PROT|nr:adenylosuccinate lyase family protein [Azospirillum griseum]
MSVGMFESLVTRHWFSAEARGVWSDRATLQAWLDVEAALARAQAELGMIPTEAARRVAEAADADRLDLDRLARDVLHAQHPFVPVLRQFEEMCGDPAAGFIHWGATTQNIFDTAAALQMRRTHAMIVERLNRAETALARLAHDHRDTPQAGRTHGQHALPITFGFKVAGWLEETRRDRARLEERIAGSFVACFGGAVGTFAAMEGRGREVEALAARILGLEPSGLPMRGSFDRAADYMTALGLLAGTARKIAGDVVFMQRTEIAEVEEAFHMGKVGSSTMAQKRNPSTALTLISLCRMTNAHVGLALDSMVRMDEGDSSATNVADALYPTLGVLGVSVAQTLEALVTGLVVHADAMRRNLDLTNGLIVSEAVMMRLSNAMGRHHAHHLLYDAAQRSVMEGVPFARAIREHAAMRDFKDVDLPLDPAGYLGDSAALAEDAARPTPSPEVA